MKYEQNTPEWLELRRTKIGASDAAIILGLSPWRTPLELWEEKVGIRKPQETNYWMQRGHDLEPVARQEYIDKTGIYVDPEVVFHPELDWMMSSIDGLSYDKKHAVEIKCPGIADHESARAGVIPSKYYPQLQHQMCVLGLDYIDYFSYRNEGDHVLVVVDRDQDFINKMLIEEEEFYAKMMSFTPPKMSDSDEVKRDDNQWKEAVHKWKMSKIHLDLAKEQEAKDRDVIIQMTNGRNTRGHGVKVSKVVTKGRVDYKAIEELKGVDLEKYRANPSESYRITIEKEKD